MGEFLNKTYKKIGVGADRDIGLDILPSYFIILENIISNGYCIESGCKKCEDNGYIFINKGNGGFGKMSVVCDCAISADNFNKAYELWKKSNIPKNLIIRYTFYNWEKINGFEKMLKDKKWLYLYGNAGVGKTYLAVLLAKIALLKEMSVFYIKIVDLLDRLRPNGDENSNNLMDKCKNVKFLILDDIGHEKVSEWVRERIFSLISSRWDNGLTTIFTSNFDVENIKEKINEAVYSRIKGESDIVYIGGKDKRLN